MAAKGLLALPHEMLARIKSHIHSLADHVHFSLTCRTLKDLYDEKFWQYACMSAGWTMLETSGEIPLVDLSEPHSTVSDWATLARVVVHDAKVFDHAEDRSIRGLTALDVIFEVDDSKLTIPAIKTKKEVKHNKIELERPEWIAVWHPPQADWKGLFQVPLLQAEEDGTVKLELLAHPYLANRFFTSPPVQEVRVSCGKVERQTTVRNKNGVTVHEVYVALTEQLERVPKEHWAHDPNLCGWTWQGPRSYGPGNPCFEGLRLPPRISWGHVW